MKNFANVFVIISKKKLNFTKSPKCTLYRYIYIQYTLRGKILINISICYTSLASYSTYH